MASLTSGNGLRERPFPCATRRVVRWCLLGWLLGAWFSPVTVRAANVAEYDLKAAFLYNFAQFVDWPAEAFPAEDTPFVIGILGPDPFGGVLEEIVRNDSLRGHRFVVERFRTADEIAVCHILFIPGRNSTGLAASLARLAGRPILTVGEADDFVLNGGTVGFRMENKRVRLAINLGAARAAQLTISSKLLRSAEVVDGGVATLGSILCATHRSNDG